MVPPDERDLERARAMWRYRGRGRPPFAVAPGPGQESVWDYPRPPRLEEDRRRVRVVCGSTVVADTTGAFRILETASPPTFYLPFTDVRRELLTRARGGSFCEWKGRATYWSLRVAGETFDSVAWSYEAPLAPYHPIQSYLSFYPARLECYVDNDRVRPQPGGFYGGWVTGEVVGPFKGEPGTSGW